MKPILNGSAWRISIFSVQPRAARLGTIPTSICSSITKKGKFGLFELMDVKEYATNILGRHADIMTRDSLHKTLRRQIEATAERVF